MPPITQPDEWNKEYNRLKEAISKARSTGLLIPNDKLNGYTNDTNTLFTALKNMKRDLATSVSQGEFSRMEVVVENLRKQLQSMSSAHLLHSGGASKIRTDIEMHDIPNPVQQASSNNLSTFSDKGLIQRQQEIMKLQDAALKDIEKGVGRLHDQAKDISAETQLHLNIINKLDTSVDDAASDLRTEAKHAEKVRLRSQVCSLYICLAAEVLILGILLIVVFQHGGFKKA